MKPTILIKQVAMLIPAPAMAAIIFRTFRPAAHTTPWAAHDANTDIDAVSVALLAAAWAWQAGVLVVETLKVGS